MNVTDKQKPSDRTTAKAALMHSIQAYKINTLMNSLDN